MTLIRRTMVLLALLASAPSYAAIYNVGTPTPSAPCSHSTIAAAIAAAASNPGPDKIRLATNLTYVNQALTINSNDDLEIVGGFLACNRFSPEPNVKVTIDGANATVLRIFSNGLVTLRNLEISGGNAIGDGYGGGIHFRGNGDLVIHDSAIINNIAGYGGGIYAEGTSGGAELVIGENVTISGNTARFSGGGIFADAVTLAMVEPGSVIAFNEALGTTGGGYGGGLRIITKDGRDSRATIGSAGIGDIGAIHGNQAIYGGGVAVAGGDGPCCAAAVLNLKSSNPPAVGAIRQNYARLAGGGIYAKPRADFQTVGSPATAEIFITQRAVLDGNASANGAAAYLDSDTDGIGQTQGARFNLLEGSISGNLGENPNGDMTDGAAVYGGDDASLVFNRAILDGNVGGPVIRGDSAGDGFGIIVNDASIVGNTSLSSVINTQGGDSPVVLRRVTIAGNAIGGSHALTLSDDVTLVRSIVDQPGKQVLSGGGNRTIDYVLGNEIFTLGSGSHILAANPRFIDPARGNFRLRAASPAVDYAPVENGTDMDGSPRSVDLPIVPDRNGAFDLGAYERQTLNPPVLNANFDVDANFWPSTGTGTSAWTSEQNAEGAAVSGSLYVSGTGFTTTGSSQCIHLPGPARYTLSGWGRAAVATNASSLRWFFRRNGGESCTAGAPDRVGDLVLSDLTKWGRPAPFPIDVSPADWTDNSSITIEFVVSGRDPRGWFDGITLEATQLDDRIFANGFD